MNTHPTADDLGVRWRVVDNLQGGTARMAAALTLINEGSRPLAGGAWALYFNFPRQIFTERLPAEVAIEHVNGDLYRLAPTAAFAPLPPGGRLAIPFEAANWVINRSEAPAGFYLVTAGGPPAPLTDVEVEPFTSHQQTARTADDQVPVVTPQLRYERSAGLSALPPGPLSPITPTPVYLAHGTGTVRLSRQTTIHHDAGLEREAAYLADVLAPLLGARPALQARAGTAPDAVQLRLGAVTVQGEMRDAEAYRLVVEPEDGIRITGSDAAGVFYGIQSLHALLPLDAYRVPRATLDVQAVTVEDAPRFAYRGQHLDVARHFQTAEAVRKLLDLMAFYKLNRFHFHLTDDEGWRLPVAALPELTAVGGRRGHTADERDRLVPSFGSGPAADALPGSGAYTREDFIGLLRYARDRHIEVIPEIDVPGHARAAIVAMQARHDQLLAEGQPDDARAHLLHDPDDASTYRSVQGWTDNVLDVCSPSTYRFMETVIDALVALYRAAGAPLTAVHIGGDEVPHGAWTASPACRRLIDAGEVADVQALWPYFLERVSDLLAARGLVTAGWEEITLVEKNGRRVPNPAFLDRRFRPYVWNSVWGWGGEDMAYRLANAGYEVVLSNASNLYFDLAYEKHPDEPGYYWAGFVDTRKVFEFTPLEVFRSGWQNAFGADIDPQAYEQAIRLTPQGRANILGLQGQLWSENARGAEGMEYLVFPKLLALAERAWSPPPAWAAEPDASRRRAGLEADWNAFAHRLGRRELPRLDALFGGVAYRLPPPGAVVEGDVLRANVAFPGLTIRYTTDGSEPTTDAPAYVAPVPVTGTVRLRTFDTRGRGSRTVEVAGEG